MTRYEINQIKNGIGATVIYLITSTTDINKAHWNFEWYKRYYKSCNFEMKEVK